MLPAQGSWEIKAPLSDSPRQSHVGAGGFKREVPNCNKTGQANRQGRRPCGGSDWPQAVIGCPGPFLAPGTVMTRRGSFLQIVTDWPCDPGRIMRHPGLDSAFVCKGRIALMIFKVSSGFNILYVHPSSTGRQSDPLRWLWRMPPTV